MDRVYKTEEKSINDLRSSSYFWTSFRSERGVEKPLDLLIFGQPQEKDPQLRINTAR